MKWNDCFIHSNLFMVIGQQEVNVLVKKLRSKFPGKSSNLNDIDEDVLESALKLDKKSKKTGKVVANTTVKSLLPQLDLSNFKSQPLDTTETDVLDHNDDDDDDDDEDADLDENDEEDVTVNKMAQPLYVLPLYSLLSTERQQLIWEGPPDGSR